MKSTKEQYAELLNLTQLYLLREFNSDQWKLADQDSHAFFRELLQKKKPPSKPAPLPPQPIVETAPAVLPPPQPAPPQATPKPTPIAQPSEKSIKKPGRFELDPMETPTSSDFGDIQKMVTDKLPQLQLVSNVPSDVAAKDLQKPWLNPSLLPPVVSLSYSEAPKEKAFLHNLTRAITTCLVPAILLPAQAIEQENGWETFFSSPNLRLIVASQHQMEMFPGLMRLYREEARSGSHFFGKTPLFLLTDLSLYWKKPELKASLWRALEKKLSSR